MNSTLYGGRAFGASTAGKSLGPATDAMGAAPGGATSSPVSRGGVLGLLEQAQAASRVTADKRRTGREL